MENNKRKLKTIYKIAIVLGILCGLGVCYWSSQTSWEIPDNMYYQYSKEYELRFNPRTFYDDIMNEESGVFYESNLDYDPQWELKDYLFMPNYSYEFSEKLPVVIFRDIFDDDLSVWNILSIEYEILIKDDIEKMNNISYHYQKPCTYDDDQTYCHRRFEYTIVSEEIKVLDYIYGPRSSSINSKEAIYISQVDALQIANENGGKQFIREHLVKEFSLWMRLFNDEWTVVYDTNYSNSTLDITIDAITGEVK